MGPLAVWVVSLNTIGLRLPHVNTAPVMTQCFIHSQVPATQCSVIHNQTYNIFTSCIFKYLQQHLSEMLGTHTDFFLKSKLLLGGGARFTMTFTMAWVDITNHHTIWHKSVFA